MSRLYPELVLSSSIQSSPYSSPSGILKMKPLRVLPRIPSRTALLPRQNMRTLFLSESLLILAHHLVSPDKINSLKSLSMRRNPYARLRLNTYLMSRCSKVSQIGSIHERPYNITPKSKPSNFHALFLALLGGGGCCNDDCNGNTGWGGNNNGGTNNPFDSDGSCWWHGDGSSSSGSHYGFLCLSLCSILCCFYHFHLSIALAAMTSNASNRQTAWEVRGGKWSQVIVDTFKDEFIVSDSMSSPSSRLSIGKSWSRCRDLLMRLMLPEGFPDSVSHDYLEYSLWRGVQGIASQISGVLATQALLYAIGLGKGAIPTAAAVNWVLKDGIGYLSKILLSKYGRHFDVNPKGWRLFADFLENAAFGMEMLTPAFPHLFVVIGASAGAGRSAAALIQAATRSCFYAGFAAQRNFAEVIAKGEAQGMVSKSIGIVLGIALGNCIASSTSLALASFGVVTWVHMFCNLRSYQSIQLRTLNPYRASLVFSEYLLSGQAPPIKEVNDEEPFFPAVPSLIVKSTFGPQSSLLSAEAKDAATEIENRLQLGSKLSDAVSSQEDVIALFNLFKNEGYILAEHKGRYCVVLKETTSPQDMLKALFHVSYLHWLERHAGIEARTATNDCKTGGRLQASLDYVQREFDHVKNDGQSVGWVMDGLIARPLPNRIIKVT